MADELSQTQVNILKGFFPEGQEITLKILMERSGYSYEPIHRNIKQLLAKKIINVKKFGKTAVYSANFEKEEFKLAFYHYMTKKVIKFKNKHPKIFRAIKELEEEPFDLIILFGSYSKGIETKESDVDLMVITDKKNKENEVYGLKYEYGLDFVPAFVKKREFLKMKKENKVLWDSLKKFGIVFKGENLFYYWVYQNEKN